MKRQHQFREPAKRVAHDWATLQYQLDRHYGIGPEERDYMGELNIMKRVVESIYQEEFFAYAIAAPVDSIWHPNELVSDLVAHSYFDMASRLIPYMTDRFVETLEILGDSQRHNQYNDQYRSIVASLLARVVDVNSISSNTITMIIQLDMPEEITHLSASLSRCRIVIAVFHMLAADTLSASGYQLLATITEPDLYNCFINIDMNNLSAFYIILTLPGISNIMNSVFKCLFSPEFRVVFQGRAYHLLQILITLGYNPMVAALLHHCIPTGQYELYLSAPVETDNGVTSTV